MAQFYDEPPAPQNDDQSTEKSIKSCYAVVYELENRKWVVSGEGGWSEVHLCNDSSDGSHRVLAWTVKSQQVLMNCNVTSECGYKEKSKNFHSFTDENGNRYGLGFHKSESGLKQASQFLKAIISVIEQCKSNEANPTPIETVNEVQPIPPTKPSAAHSPQESTTHIPDYDDYDKRPSKPPPNPYQKEPASNDNNENSKNKNENNMANANNANAPPQNAYSNNKKEAVVVEEKQEPKKVNIATPQYHLASAQQNTVPNVPIGPLGKLKILPPKQEKNFSGDSQIKNPNKVEHTLRVTHDKETGIYSGLPAEWMDVLNKQFGVNPKLLPGIKFERYNSKIPRVLVVLRNALRDANGYQQVGIFRLAPNATDNKNIKDKIDKGQLNNNDPIDVNVYANLIKVWFRDLPDPLLNVVQPTMIECVQGQDDAANVISSLVEPNKSIFLWLCDMCVEIGQFEKTNKMGPQNMAIVVGPNLFNTDQFENPMKAMTYSGKVVEFFKHSILWRKKLMQPN